MKNLFKSAIMAATVIAMTGFMSCQNDDGGQDKSAGEGQEATLSIQITNPGYTKAIGSPSAADATDIVDLNIFVLDANNNATWSAFVNSSTTLNEDGTTFNYANINAATPEPYKMKVTTGAKSIYVIANAGSDMTNSYHALDGNGVVKGLHDIKIDLGTQFTAPWASGNIAIASSDFIPDASNNNLMTATKSVPLTFVAARIKVNVDLEDFENYDDVTSPGTIIVDSIMVLNARGQSLVFPASGQTSLIPSAYDAGKTYYEGLANPTAPNNFDFYPASGTYTPDLTNLRDIYNHGGPDGSYEGVYYYVFENDALTMATFPTIVTLKARDVDGTTPVYFPVHLAPYETWAVGTDTSKFIVDTADADGDGNTTELVFPGLLRGKSYDITIKLTQNAEVSNGGGTSAPTDNVVNALVKITVVISDWEPITLIKEF